MVGARGSQKLGRESAPLGRESPLFAEALVITDLGCGSLTVMWHEYNEGAGSKLFGACACSVQFCWARAGSLEQGERQKG